MSHWERTGRRLERRTFTNVLAGLPLDVVATLQPWVRPESLDIQHQPIRDMVLHGEEQDVFLAIRGFDHLRSLFLRCLTGSLLERFATRVSNIGSDRYIVRFAVRDPDDQLYSEDEAWQLQADLRRHLTACGLQRNLLSSSETEDLYFNRRVPHQFDS